MVNAISRIIKGTGTYPINVSFFDVPISPGLADITKALVFVNFGYSAINDSAFTLRSFEIINSTTLRIFGRSDVSTGNVVVEFAYTILEFTADSDIVTQRVSRLYTGGEPEGEKSVTITAVTLANAGSLFSGYNYDSSDTTFGSEELCRSRIIDSTTWGSLIDDTPNSDATVRAQIADLGAGVAVQRGLVTMVTSSSPGITTVTPPTPIDRTRTILVFSITPVGGSFSELPDEKCLSGTINVSGDIVFTRDDGTSADDIDIAWELWEFPVNTIKVQYGSISHALGVATGTSAITTVDDLANAIIHSPSQTPFGMGIGQTNEGTAGDFGNGTAELTFDDASTVRATRQTSNDNFLVEFQVIEWLHRTEHEFTIDALLFTQQENTSLIDAIIADRKTDTFLVDALVGLTVVDFNYTVDSILSSRLTTVFSLDAFLRLQKTGVYNVDALLSLLRTNIFLVDAFVQATQDLEFVVDANVQLATSNNYTVDAFLQGETEHTVAIDSLIRLQKTTVFTIDAFVQADNNNLNYSVDAFIQATLTNTNQVDALISLERTDTVLVDSFIEKVFTDTSLVDAHLQNTNLNQQYSCDAILIATFDNGFSVDAQIKDDKSSLSTIDAFLRALDQEHTFLLDAQIEETRQIQFLTDAILSNRFTNTSLIDALLQEEDKNFNYFVDGVLSQAGTNNFTVDAILSSRLTDIFTVDATLERFFNLFFTVDARLAGGLAYTVDGLLSLTRNNAWTNDAILSSRLTEPFNVDANIAQPTTLHNFTVDANIEGATQNDFTIDAFLVFTLDLDFTIDVIISQPTTTNYTLDAFLRALDVNHVFAVDANVKTPFSDIFSTDAFLRATLDLQFQVDGLLPSGGKNAPFSVDAIIRLIGQNNFSIDALLDESTVFFTVDAIIFLDQSCAFPDEDISNAGLWTPTPLFEKIDTFQCDGNFVTRDAHPDPADSFEVGLEPLGDPGVSTGHIITINARTNKPNDHFKARGILKMNGATIIATTPYFTLESAFKVFKYTLSAVEADAITNYMTLSTEIQTEQFGELSTSFSIDGVLT